MLPGAHWFSICLVSWLVNENALTFLLISTYCSAKCNLYSPRARRVVCLVPQNSFCPHLYTHKTRAPTTKLLLYRKPSPFLTVFLWWHQPCVTWTSRTAGIKPQVPWGQRETDMFETPVHSFTCRWTLELYCNKTGVLLPVFCFTNHIFISPPRSK